MKIISSYVYDRYIGGVKAKTDIENIVQKEFEIKVENVKQIKKEKPSWIYEQILKIRRILCILKNIFSRELIILQVPFTNKKVMKLLKNKVALIHDISGLQFVKDDLLEEEIDFYKSCNYVIAHNNKMKEYLISKGIDENKIFVLELFDYICNCDYKENKIGENPVIIYSGYLLKNKVPFLYQLEEEKMNFKINLYGMGIDKDINSKIKYNGSFSPLELPNKIEGDLGLVWDGNIDESDENEGFKRYTKYNNPHKLSCYMAAGIPVIVWKKAAIAEFVEKYNVGYTISNLYDINDIDFADYEIKKENAMKISEKVKSASKYIIKKQRVVITPKV